MNSIMDNGQLKIDNYYRLLSNKCHSEGIFHYCHSEGAKRPKNLIKISEKPQHDAIKVLKKKQGVWRMYNE